MNTQTSNGALSALVGLINGWSGPALLVSRDRAVLAMSASFAALFGKDEIAGGCLICSQLLSLLTSEGDGCCIDLAQSASAPDPVLIQLRTGNCNIPALCRVEQVNLEDGKPVFFARFQTLESKNGLKAQFSWEPVLAAARASAMGQDHWLKRLNSGWIRDLCAPAWSGWMAENTPSGGEWLTHSGRLPKGLNADSVLAAIRGVRSGHADEFPFDIQLPTNGQAHVVHVIPAQAHGGWLLIMLGGRLDVGLLTLLSALVRSARRVNDAAAQGANSHGNGLGLESHQLTARQREVVEHVAQGMADKSIAREMGLSVHTVRNHLRFAMRKLGVAKRAQLAFALAVPAPVAEEIQQKPCGIHSNMELL